MPRRTLFALVLLAVFTITVRGANDWSQPCFKGECAYDLLDHTGASGILKVFASPKALTDITPAAGWVVLDCDPNTLDQDIRLVCQDDHPASGCNHVFEHSGPVDKIVRLPESCGHGPFARIARVSVAHDQSIPDHVQATIVKRDGVSPQVHMMTIDGNFHQVDPSKNGEVKIAFVGVNAPGVDLNEAFADLSWDDIVGGLTKAKEWVSKAVDTVAKAIKDDKTKFGIKPNVNTSKISLNTKPLNWTQPLSINSCPIGKVGAELTLTGWLQGRFGVVIIGSIVPPAIDDMATYGGLSAEFDAKLRLQLLLTGGFTIEKKLMDDYGLPGLTIPKIITIGPYISIIGKLQGHLKLVVDTVFHLNYKLDNLQLWYPEHAAQKYAYRNGINSGDSDLTVSASASINATGFIQATITPKLHFGLSIGSGFATASIYVGANTWVRGTISAQAQASVSNKRDLRSLPAPTSQAQGLISRARYPALRDLLPRDYAAAEASFVGCFWLDAGLDLFGGGEGKIWKYSAKADFTIWTSPEFKIFGQCWGLGTKTRSEVNNKPKYTMKEVDKLSKAPKNCPTGAKVSKAASGRTEGRKLS